MAPRRPIAKVAKPLWSSYFYFFNVKPLGILLYLCFSLAHSAFAAMDLQTLVDRSPFAPPGTSAGGEAPVEPGTLEFRGVVVDETGTSYSVFDATANRGYWVSEGGDGPIQVKSYNAQDNILEITQNGRAVKLMLKRATIQAGAAMALAVPRPANTNQTGAPAANPAADAGRLEAVAAEVRRRRALRSAATTPTTPITTPAPQAR